MPLFQAEFIWDDDTLVTQNPLVLSPKGIYQCWISSDAPDYIPLTISSLWIEWRLWGKNATGYHITNILIHLFTCVGIAGIFRQLHWKGGWIAAILFAVHPVNVESVAWITQRKNVLCFFFTILSLFFFLKNHQMKCKGIHSTVLFLCALLCKAASIMLPFWLIILLLVHYKTNFRQSFQQVFPLMILSVIFSAITIFFQHKNALDHVAVRSDTLFERFLFAFQAFQFYLYKVFFPKDLCFVYAIQPDIVHMLFGICLFIFLTVLLYQKRDHSWARAGILAFSFYVLNLIPISGLFDIYFMRFSWVADHWQSFSLIGMTSLVAALSGIGMEHNKLLTILSTIVLVVIFSIKTHEQCKLYKTEQILWEKTLICNANSILPHDRLALIAVENNQYDLAKKHLQTSISIDTNNWEAHMNLGNLYRRTHQYDKANQHYKTALSIQPKRPELYINLGNLNVMRNQYEKALDNYKNALSFGADNAYVHYQLGMAYFYKKNVEKAIDHFQRAISFDSEFISAHFYVGTLLKDIRPFDAIRHLEMCISRNHYPNKAHLLLGKIYIGLCRCDQAISHYKKAGESFDQKNLIKCGCM
jgi:Tfp pilus assembly protein PilF